MNNNISLLDGKKNRIIVCCLLIVVFCLTQQVIASHAESAKLPDEPKQENPEKKGEVKEYESQIDQMVYELYGLTTEEIEIVENSNI